MSVDADGDDCGAIAEAADGSLERRSSAVPSAVECRRTSDPERENIKHINYINIFVLNEIYIYTNNKGRACCVCVLKCKRIHWL